MNMKRSFLQNHCLHIALLVSITALLSMMLSCGGGGGGGGGGGNGGSICTSGQPLALLDIGGSLLSSVTVTAAQNTTVSPVIVLICHTTPPVVAIVVGYPPGSVDPRTVGMNVQIPSIGGNNPASLTMTFDSTLPKAIYQATFRFVAVDAGAHPIYYVDLPTTFTIN